MTRSLSTPHSPTPRWSRTARFVAVVALGASVLAACGSSGGPVAAPDSSDDSGPVAASDTDTSSPASSSTADASSSATSAAADGSAVAATVPATLPEDLVGQIGEVEVIGEPLPQMVRGATIETDPGRGLKAPVLVGADFSGEPVRVDPAETGRPALILFLAHWCPHCNYEVPVINDLRDSNAFRPNLDVYGVSTAVDPNAPNFPPSKWLKDRDWTYPVIVDGVVDVDSGQTFLAQSSFGSGGFPMAVLLNADGTVAARWSGETPGDVVISNIETYLAF